MSNDWTYMNVFVLGDSLMLSTYSKRIETGLITKLEFKNDSNEVVKIQGINELEGTNIVLQPHTISHINTTDILYHEIYETTIPNLLKIVKE